MATRFHQTVQRRVPLPLTDADEAELALLKSDAGIRATLAELSGAPVAGGSATEAALLHALLEVGWQAVRDRAEEAGYAELASQRAADADQRRAEARRRRPGWADEG